MLNKRFTRELSCYWRARQKEVPYHRCINLHSTISGASGCSVVYGLRDILDLSDPGKFRKRAVEPGSFRVGNRFLGIGGS